jgi:signal transduction histidine kinase
MALSAIRVRLTLGFAAAFAAAFVALDVALLVQREREGAQALAANADRIAHDVGVALARELSEPETATLPKAAAEALREWPADGAGITISSRSAGVLATRAAGGTVRTRTERAVPQSDARIQVELPGDPLEAELGTLRRTMLVLSPLLLALAGAAGYGLARWSLTPVDELRAEIAGLERGDASARLGAATRADEIGTVAVAFNQLLDTLGAAERRNRSFVAEAAHQLRTPLTLVRGEADLALAAPDASREALLGALGRVARAAEQMHRRVDDLALVAEAQATRGLEVRAPLDLAAVAHESADLMAHRLRAAQMTVRVDAADAVMLEGDDRLLREAALELIENACRHATPGTLTRVVARREGASAALGVESTGPAFDAPVESLEGDARERRHLGLAIVRWIAEAHGGTLAIERSGERTLVVLRLPATPA